MQHRVTQRLDKEIALLREALGLSPLPPEEVVRTHVTSKDPISNEDLEIASVHWNAEWARAVTMRGIESVRKALDVRGYSYLQRRDGHVIHHEWAGRKDGKADTLAIATVGRSWAVSVKHGSDEKPFLPLNASKGSVMEQGIPLEMTASEWDGTFSTKVAQSYAQQWATLIKSVGV